MRTFSKFTCVLIERNRISVELLSAFKPLLYREDSQKPLKTLNNAKHNVSIQEITEQEYHEVMAIRKPEDVYHGWDYLPDYYLPLIRTPGYTAYASYIASKVVAFGLSVVVDGGKTLVTRAGRVSKEYEGQGVFRELDTYIRHKYESMPNVLYQAVTFTNENQRMKESIKSGSFKLILNKKIHTYRSTAEVMKKYLDKFSPRIRNAAAFGRENMEKIFSSKETCDSLFPDNKFVIDWVPYRPIVSNVHFMVTDRCMIMGSSSTQSEKEVQCSLLTCGTFLRCNAGFNYNFDVYGTDKTLLIDHIYPHLKCIKNRFSGQIRFVIYSYDTIDGTHCDEVMSTFGFKRIESPISGLYCAEKILFKWIMHQ